jgi:hypothetical protein
MVRFIPAKESKDMYGVFGHFYSVELAPNKVVHCRSVLEIVEKRDAPEKTSVLSSMPSLQKQKLLWVNRMVKQCQG